MNQAAQCDWDERRSDAVVVRVMLACTHLGETVPEAGARAVHGAARGPQKHTARAAMACSCDRGHTRQDYAPVRWEVGCRSGLLGFHSRVSACFRQSAEQMDNPLCRTDRHGEGGNRC